MKVCVYVEGGGPNASGHATSACRQAFRLFLDKVLIDRRKPRIVACGSRDDAYRDFCRSLKYDTDTFAVLLVDSEDRVASGKTAKEHLHGREAHWKEMMPDGQVYLMVQCMESWFLADKSALKEYYGEKCNLSALPANPKIEDIPKKGVMRGLALATKATRKGPYHKTRHGFDLLERVDAAEVAKASPHAGALVELLLAKLI